MGSTENGRVREKNQWTGRKNSKNLLLWAREKIDWERSSNSQGSMEKSSNSQGSMGLQQKI